jgi:hypothetical protein
MFVMSSRRRNKGSYIEREEALNMWLATLCTTIIPSVCFNRSVAHKGLREKVRIGFAPLGLFLATWDGIADREQLGTWLKVNSVFRQCSSASEILDVPTLVS